MARGVVLRGHARSHPESYGLAQRLVSCRRPNSGCGFLPSHRASLPPYCRPMDDAADYRARATEARRIAENSTNPVDKETWLKVAGEWEKLAESAEGKK
jgi:hypothetical protein